MPGYGGYKNGVITCAGMTSRSAEASRAPSRTPAEQDDEEDVFGGAGHNVPKV
ncbi:MAG: hypothetical protein MZV64_17380 [Ignavibacteriales bacterium]|nr:hypothetical protein [Ignavibacteriales bacterium]